MQTVKYLAKTRSVPLLLVPGLLARQVSGYGIMEVKRNLVAQSSTYRWLNSLNVRGERCQQLIYQEMANSVSDNSKSFMMTSSYGNIFRVTGCCAGNSPTPGEFPAQRPVKRSFDLFFDLRLNTRLSKQSWGWWFETLSRPLWRHCNDPNKCCLIVDMIQVYILVNML